MRHIHGLLLVLATLVSLVIAMPASAQQTYTHPSGFTLQIPQGWVQAPQEVIDAMNGALAELKMKVPIRYDAGFMPSGTVDMERFAVVQVINEDNRTRGWTTVRSRVERTFSSGAIDKAMPVEFKDSKIGSPVFNDQRRSYSTTSVVPGVDGNPAACLSTVYMRRDNGIAIHYYCPTPAPAKDHDTYTALASSFWGPPATEQPEGSELTAYGAGRLVGSLIGLIIVVAGLKWVVGLFRR